MEKLPLNIDTQIEDILLGKSREAIFAKQEKLWFVASNIERIHKVNGNEVYNVIIRGETIYYELEPIPEKWLAFDDGERTYYYPIEYAHIEFTD